MKTSMKTFVWLVRKDLALFFADRQGALMTVLVPVVLASLLGMLFAPRGGNSALGLLIVQQDADPAVSRFVGAISDAESFAVEQVSEDEARARIAAGRASLALILPLGTAAALQPAAMFSGERVRAELLFDPSDAIEVGMAKGLLTQLLMSEVMSGLSDLNTVARMFDTLEAQLPNDAKPDLRAFMQSGRALSDTALKADGEGSAGNDGGANDGERSSGSAMQPPLIFETQETASASPANGYNSYAHNFAGMLLMFLLFAAQERAKQLVSERDDGTLTRLRLSAASDTQIVLGVAASTAVIALLASVGVYLAGMLVFGVEVRGSWPGFLGVLVAQALFVGGFAVLLAGVGRTKEQISGLGSFAVLLMSFAGGAMFPSFLMPEWLRVASQALPTFWATDGLAAMTWRGLELSAAALPMAVLLGAAVLCGAIGLRLFRFRT